MNVTVLVVDDSAFMRQLIKTILETDPRIKVVGVAVNGEDALRKIDFYKPKVVTLDLEMPKMDGLTCLKHIMADHPRPVIIISTWAKEGAETTLKALELGAVDFVTKPSTVSSEGLWELKDEIIQKVKIAALARPQRIIQPDEIKEKRVSKEKRVLSVHPGRNQPQILCIGASTGGPKAIQYLLAHLPADFPLPILIAQHMPEDFINIFATRLNGLGPLKVKRAKEGDLLRPGQALISPSGLQTGVTKIGKDVFIKLTEEKSIYRPSIDHLFFSVAQVFKGDVISILLTGMGADGAKGLKKLRSLGARTIAESEETCVIYGMPRVAVEIEAVDYLLPLVEIPNLVCTLLTT